MYLNDHVVNVTEKNKLGDLGQFSSSSFVSSGAGFAARTIASFIPQVSSFAGPIGTLVGGIVSIFMSLFGGVSAVPIFAVTVIVPQDQKPTVRRILAYLQKSMFNWRGYGGLTDSQVQDVVNTINSHLKAGEPGGIVLEAGGLPAANEAVAKVNYGSLTSHLIQTVQPYIALIGAITNSSIKEDLLNTPLSLEQSKSRFLNLDVWGKQKKPAWLSLQPLWDEYAITKKYQNLNKAIDQGFTKLFDNLNQVISSKVGVDPQTGSITNQQLADTAFKASGVLTSSIVSFWPLLFIAGMLYIGSRPRQ